MSISASTSVGEKGSPPTIDEVESWTRPEKIIEFLRGQNLRLEESDFDVFSNQDVDGTEFLDLSQEDLERWKVPGGRAKKIMRLIKKIKGEGEATTASNQELQELKERLAILQASKVGEEVSIYFQYLNSEIMRLSSNDWNSLSELHTLLEKVFGLRGALLDHIFSIGDKYINISWSKDVLINYIQKQKCSANNPIRISDKKTVKRSYLDMLGGLPAPSKLGEPEEWYKRQKHNAVDAICLNHCPPTASSSIPVSLLCSIFGKFKDLCNEASESEDNLFAFKFCFQMAECYNSEAERQDDANRMLSKYLDRSVQPIVVLPKGYRTDGTVSYGPNKYRELNVEYKNYNCSSDACPYLENCGYFLAFCKEMKDHSAYHVTNFPCFLVVISGPYFSVSGAVFADKAIVDPLTPVFPLIWQQYDEAMMVSIAKTFRALKISLQLLHQYYANVDELIQDVPQTVHPVHPSFPEVIIDDKSYVVQINSQISTNLLWEVTLLNEQEPHLIIYVKAVQKHQYSLDTHQLLAEVGYAPKVLATSVIPGNWLLIYMECLNNHSILHNISNLEDSERNSLKKKIKEVVEYLHNLEHVHGDLREGNILVRQLEDNEFDVKLIDFEWSGKVGSARYSPFMNRKDIQWPDGAQDCKLVTKNHDLFMLEQTLRKKNLV